jgi:hypothetical protein
MRQARGHYTTGAETGPGRVATEVFIHTAFESRPRVALLAFAAGLAAFAFYLHGVRRGVPTFEPRSYALAEAARNLATGRGLRTSSPDDRQLAAAPGPLPLPLGSDGVAAAGFFAAAFRAAGAADAVVVWTSALAFAAIVAAMTAAASDLFGVGAGACAAVLAVGHPLLLGASSSGRPELGAALVLTLLLPAVERARTTVAAAGVGLGTALLVLLQAPLLVLVPVIALFVPRESRSGPAAFLLGCAAGLAPELLRWQTVGIGIGDLAPHPDPSLAESTLDLLGGASLANVSATATVFFFGLSLLLSPPDTGPQVRRSRALFVACAIAATAAAAWTGTSFHLLALVPGALVWIAGWIVPAEGGGRALRFAAFVAAMGLAACWIAERDEEPGHMSRPVEAAQALARFAARRTPDDAILVVDRAIGIAPEALAWYGERAAVSSSPAARDYVRRRDGDRPRFELRAQEPEGESGATTLARWDGGPWGALDVVLARGE